MKIKYFIQELGCDVIQQKLTRENYKMLLDFLFD